MKVIKELPLSIFYSTKLMVILSGRFLKSNKKRLPVIVSLTSIPSRLRSLHLVIRSLLNQEVLPKKIILWLNSNLKDKIPSKLKKLESEIFEIQYSNLYCSHRKLIHSLEKYPNDTIITCDDDLMYRKDWLKLLYQEHLKNPSAIIGNHTVHINHDGTGLPLPFKKWKFPKEEQVNIMAIAPIGAWGILYPAHSLSNKVIDQELFLKLAPKADDLWFKAMAVIKGTISLQAKRTPKEPIPIAGTQKIALKKENLKKDKNTVQWNSLNSYFKLNTHIIKYQKN